MQNSHPRQQQKLIGHEEVESAILQSISSGRVPHAWLLVGEEGIGKATLAYRFARFMLANGQAAKGLSISPDHPTAKLLHAGSHPDLIALEREFDEKKGRMQKSIPVDEVRKIAPFLHMTASQSAWRIVIIDGADNLNRNGQNALLKILEEPPPQSLIILTAESTATLLPTIRSRSRTVKLQRLSNEQLAEIAKLNKLGDHPALDVLINMAAGSASRLIRYAENEAHILFKSWCDFVQKPDHYQTRLRMAETWTAKDNDGLFFTAQDIIFLWLQRLIAAKARENGVVPLSAEEKPLQQQLYPRLRLDQLMHLWENLNLQTRQLEASNLDRKVVFLNMLDKTALALAA
jgi:DNA polymerase-3 subunit delta'